MSLRRQLRELQRQQRQELQNLHRATLRARAEIHPRRLIRHHPVAALSTAALAGMMLAPRPTPRYVYIDAETTPEESARLAGGRRHQPRHRFGWLWRAVLRAIPEAQLAAGGGAPSECATRDDAHTPPADQAPNQSLSDLLESLATHAITTLLTQIDLAAVARAWYEGFTGKAAGENSSSDGHDPETDDGDPARSPTPDL